MKKPFQIMSLKQNFIVESLTMVQLDQTNYDNLKYDDDDTRKDLVNKTLLDDINAAAKSVNIVATITTAKSGHNKNVKGSNRTSRHMNGTAVDVSILNDKGSGGATNSSNGNAEFRNLGTKLKNALVSMGYTWNSEINNDKAVLWQTNTGGNHYNHLHISNRTNDSSSNSEENEMTRMTIAQMKKVSKMESKTFFSGGKPIKIISTPSDHAKRSTSDWSSRHAWDIQAPIGTSVYSLTHGKVAKKHESSGKKKNIFGTQLSITGENGDPSVFYTHLDSVKLEPGDKVKPGDFIGKITEWPSYPSSSHVHIGTDQGKDIFEFMDKEGIIKNAPDVPSDEDAPEQVEFNVVKVDKEKIKKALEDFFSTGTKKLDDIEAELNKQNATMYPNKKISEEKNRILDIFSKIL
jgi:hypothetical protein